jgi:hypothetical protein
MVLAIGVFAGLLLVRIFVVLVGHQNVPSQGVTTSNRPTSPSFLSEKPIATGELLEFVRVTL